MIWIPKLLFAIAAPFVLIAAFSVYVRGEWVRDVLRVLRGKGGTPDRITVWSNAVYPVAAFAALPNYPAFAAVWGTGVLLAFGSAAYHATGDRWAQRYDVAAMFPYIGSVFVAAFPTSLWAWALIPALAVTYSVNTWLLNSFLHVPLWAALAVVAATVQVGPVALWALPPAALGRAVEELLDDGPWEGVAHGLWHVGSASSVAICLFFLRHVA